MPPSLKTWSDARLRPRAFARVIVLLRLSDVLGAVDAVTGEALVARAAVRIFNPRAPCDRGRAYNATTLVLAYDTARHMRDPLTALPLSRDAERAVRGLAASVLRRGVRTRRQLGDMKALRRDAADILAGGAADGRQ